MKNYIALPNQTSSKFAPIDLYTLTGLFFTAHDNNRTDITYNQLHIITGLSEEYIKKGFSKRLKESNFCEIQSVYNYNQKKTRKTYILPSVNENFRIIRKELFDDPNLKPEEKGFLIGLYCNCVNNTFSLGLSVDVLLSKMKIKRSNFYRLRSSLLQKGYMNKIEDMPEFFRRDDFLDDYMLTCPWLGYTDYNTWIRNNQFESI